MTDIAILSYSHGGGSAYGLSWRLNQNAIGALTDITKPFTVPLTSYIDAIGEYSVVAETRRPIGSAFHVNQFQTVSFLHGNHAGGDDDIDRTYRGVNHDTIEDDPIVLDLVKTRLLAKVKR